MPDIGGAFYHAKHSHVKVHDLKDARFIMFNGKYAIVLDYAKEVSQYKLKFDKHAYPSLEDKPGFQLWVSPEFMKKVSDKAYKNGLIKATEVARLGIKRASKDEDGEGTAAETHQ